MRIQIIVMVIFINIITTALVADVDPFYQKIFKDGKILFNEKKYNEAIENFKIAEFGLFEEKKVVTEIYIYYALSYFKQKKWKESRDVIKKLMSVEEELKLTDLVIIPFLTRNTVAKIVNAMTDSMTTNLIFDAVLMNKPIIAVSDGADPDILDCK